MKITDLWNIYKHVVRHQEVLGAVLHGEDRLNPKTLDEFYKWLKEADDAPTIHVAMRIENDNKKPKLWESGEGDAVEA